MELNCSRDSVHDGDWILDSNTERRLSRESRLFRVLNVSNLQVVRAVERKRLVISISWSASSQNTMMKLRTQSLHCRGLPTSKVQVIQKSALFLRRVSLRTGFLLVTLTPMFWKPLVEMITNNWKALEPLMLKFDWFRRKCLHLHSHTSLEARNTTSQCANEPSIVVFDSTNLVSFQKPRQEN